MARRAVKKPKLRIGIDCRTMLNPVSGERAGVGHYTFHIVKALLDIDRQNRYFLYFDHRMPRAVTDSFERQGAIVRRLPWSRYGKFLPFAYAHLLIASFLNRDRLDVFHATANVMPLSYQRPTVVTIHDLAIYREPTWFPSQPASTKILVPQSVRKAAAVIAVSQATKHDLVSLLQVPAKKVQVVYEAADTSLLKLHDRQMDLRAMYHLPKRYILYVGSIDPRKSLTTLIQAWQRLTHAYPKVVRGTGLLLAGGAGYRGRDVLDLLRTLKSPSIQYLGYVSHNHKVMLMREAEAFVFPTKYEGFGLPVLEAMQLGTPVITTNVSSLPEITGEAALLVPPNNVDELAIALRHVLTRPALARKLRRTGKAQAKKFSWTKAAKATIAVYRRAANRD